MAHILIIDDEVQARETLRELFEYEGYEVTEAPDGMEGMKIFREKPTDLVITDIVMPDKDGIETIMELKNEFPGVRIIAISGGGRIGPEHYLEMAGQLGAMRTFLKPVDLEKLSEAVREILSQVF